MPDPNEVEKLKEELAKATARAEENLDGWKRAKADYSNLKKDTDKEKIEIAGFATGTLLFELLPIVDNFERAMDHVPTEQKEQDWVKGMFGIHQQLQAFFKDMGLERVPTEGVFNPEVHEVVAQEVHEGKQPGMIVGVVAPGYKMHGRLLRPAQVKVVMEVKKS